MRIFLKLSRKSIINLRLEYFFLILKTYLLLILGVVFFSKNNII